MPGSGAPQSSRRRIARPFRPSVSGPFGPPYGLTTGHFPSPEGVLALVAAGECRGRLSRQANPSVQVSFASVRPRAAGRPCGLPVGYTRRAPTGQLTRGPAARANPAMRVGFVRLGATPCGPCGRPGPAPGAERTRRPRAERTLAPPPERTRECRFRSRRFGPVREAPPRASQCPDCQGTSNIIVNRKSPPRRSPNLVATGRYIPLARSGPDATRELYRAVSPLRGKGRMGVARSRGHGRKAGTGMRSPARPCTIPPHSSPTCPPPQWMRAKTGRPDRERKCRRGGICRNRAGFA